jgi:hypothetical protein
MQELNKLDTVDLVDILAEYTERFTQLFSTHPMPAVHEQQYLAYKEIIGILMDELARRRLFAQDNVGRISA